MTPNRNTILVKIDKQLKELKRTKIGQLFISRMFSLYKNNLQFGEIVGIGVGCDRFCDGLEVGGMAIFSHVVEGSESSANSEVKSDPGCLLYETDEHEIRYIKCSEDIATMLFGAIGKDGSMFVAVNILFLDTNMVSSKIQVAKGIQINSQEERKNCLNQIAACRAEKDLLLPVFRMNENESTYKLIESASKRINELDSQIKKLSKKSQSISLMDADVSFVPNDKRVISGVMPGETIVIDGSVVYPLELTNGVRFGLIQKFYASVWGKWLGSRFVPLNDRVIVKPTSRAKLKKSAIIEIPETGGEKFHVGNVVDLPDGNSSYDYSNIKIGDLVIFHLDARSSAEIYLDDEKHYLVHYELIVSRL